MKILCCPEKVELSSTKELERQIFSNFFEKASHALNLVKWIQCEKPDILCESKDGKIIGVEIFEYIKGAKGRKGSEERESENLAFAITNEIEIQLRKNISGPLICKMAYPHDLKSTLKNLKI